MRAGVGALNAAGGRQWGRWLHRPWGTGRVWPMVMGKGDPDTELLKVLLLVSDSCWGRPTQQAAPLTAWVTPEDGDTSPLLHVGKLTTGAEDSAGADVPVWERNQNGTPGRLWHCTEMLTAAWLIMADRTKQKQTMAGSTELLISRSWGVNYLHLMKYYTVITKRVVKD